MRLIQSIKIAALALVPIYSCIPPSNAPLQEVVRPNHPKIKAFGIELSGEVVYQFYQKYGFTDLQEHLILILRPDTANELSTSLPLTTNGLTNLKTISTRKFVADSTIRFAAEKYKHADIRLEAFEFHVEPEPPISTKHGTYEVIQTDSTETIVISDKKSGMIYIESKKSSFQ